MIIDLTNIMIGSTDSVSVDGNVVIDDDYLENTSIKELNDTKFVGKVVRLSDSEFEISGKVTGVMILVDDVTLEDVNYSYQSDIEEVFDGVLDDDKLQIIQNSLDITDFLWQNILVEVPSKIRKDSNRVNLEGNGWRLISEDEYNQDNESPLSELSKIFNSGKE